MVRRQENDLSLHTGARQPEIDGKSCRVKEVQSSINNQQFMVNPSYDLFNANHVQLGYTSRHLQQCLIEKKNSAIDKHLLKADGSLCHLNENQFRILCKCCTKFEWLVNEMPFIN